MSDMSDGNKFFVTKAEYIYQKLFNDYSDLDQEQYVYAYTYICKLAYIFICVHTYYRYVHKYANIHI